MPLVMSTSKESPRGDVCAAQRHGVISAAETMSTAAEARNLHRLIILFVLPFRGRLLDCTTPTEICSRAKKDRKSTRLNSSHSQISYAVFCLKKKPRGYF